MLLEMQPHLFEEVLSLQDDPLDDPIEITGGYRDYDMGNENDWKSWRAGYRSIAVRKAADAPPSP